MPLDLGPYEPGYVRTVWLTVVGWFVLMGLCWWLFLG